MTKFIQFPLPAVLISALALILLFSVPQVNATGAHTGQLPSTADGNAKTCPWAGRQHGAGGGANDQERLHWLLLHVHGLHPDATPPRVDREAEATPASPLIEVRRPIPADSRLSANGYHDARVHSF